MELIDWTFYYPRRIVKSALHYIYKKKAIAESKNFENNRVFDLWTRIWGSYRHFFGKNSGPNSLWEFWAFWYIVGLKRTTVAKVMTIWSLHVIFNIFVLLLLCNWVVSLFLQPVLCCPCLFVFCLWIELSVIEYVLSVIIYYWLCVICYCLW